jgi:hypothetical protein
LHYLWQRRDINPKEIVLYVGNGEDSDRNELQSLGVFDLYYYLLTGRYGEE